MISTAMLALVRTWLQESTAAFWSDAEVYTALSTGQRELVRMAVKDYEQLSIVNPTTDVLHILVPLQKAGAITITSSSGSLPSDYLHLISGTFTPTGGSATPILRRRQNSATAASQVNTFLTGTAAHEYYAWVAGTSLTLETSGLAGTANIAYISIPVDIDATHNATIPDDFHNAVCQFAYGQLLKKTEDETQKKSQIEYDQFQMMRQ